MPGYIIHPTKIHSTKKYSEIFSFFLMHLNNSTAMKKIFLNGIFSLLLISLAACGVKTKNNFTHGPILSSVTDSSAAIWIRTDIPGKVKFVVAGFNDNKIYWVRNMYTKEDVDNTCIARISGLKPDTRYKYEIVADNSKYINSFTTNGPSLFDRKIRIVYGYGYQPKEDEMPEGTSIFSKMQTRKADAIFFLGDFPYTAKGSKVQIRNGNKELREIIGFKELTAGTATYGIYDDHDFGPNDCDGLHENADEALSAFKEYWPNPSYGLENDKGIYCTFIIGDAEFFLLDGRYASRQVEDNPTMLGKIQFEWLCKGLSKSNSRYKVLVSGTPFSRVKNDCWAGIYYIHERDRLFKYINDNHINGVIGISGDIHRNDIFKIPIGVNNYFYDFTAGALARIHRHPPEQYPEEMIYSYGYPERNLFAEIDFYPKSNRDTALVFRAFSGKNGLIYEYTLTPEELMIK